MGNKAAISWVARAHARSRREIHRYALGVMYARRGGASATSGPVGGGVPVLSDLSDWRSFPERREARYKAALELIDEGLQEAIIMRDDEGRRRWMGALKSLTVDLPVHAER